MRWPAVASLSLIALTAGCSGGWTPRSDPVGCEPGDTAMVREVLYFGRHRPGGVVSEHEWAEFVDQIVTPRFPGGFTITSATGQWRNDRGAIDKEESAVVTILHAGGATGRRAIADITDTYKSRFQQQAVLRERSHSCVKF